MSITYFDEIDSTNLYLKENYQKLNNLDSVVANHQTKGRGRMGRVWLDQDDLLMSILIKEKVENPTSLSMLICYTIFKVLKRRIDDVKIKWPNDILVRGKKICGILLEGRSENDNNIIVIGFGVNVNTTSFPNDLLIKATSLKLELKEEVNVKDLSQEIYREFLVDFLNFKMGDTNYIKVIRKESYIIDKDVSFTIDDRKVVAHVVDILDNGNILLNYNGELIEKRSGEISLHENY